MVHPIARKGILGTESSTQLRSSPSKLLPRLHAIAGYAGDPRMIKNGLFSAQIVR